MGKVNIDQLKEMLKNGQSQADCARHFEVSEAAICKAVKKMNAAVLPESMEKLTKKERNFVLNLAEGKSPTESAMTAYDCKSRDVAKTLGCRMAKDPDISTAFSDIMAQEGIPKRRRIQRLSDLIECNDLSAVSRGLDMSWKLDGSYAPVQSENLTLIDIRALIATIPPAKIAEET
jgi:predicted transcriptional regulator